MGFAKEQHIAVSFSDFSKAQRHHQLSSVESLPDFFNLTSQTTVYVTHDAQLMIVAIP